jgi:hypothetical protein
VSVRPAAVCAQIIQIGMATAAKTRHSGAAHNGGVARVDRLAQRLQAVMEIARQVHGMGCAGT